ncbi:MAG: hypothetical protein IJP96_04685 [Synergistaceae bacterium]|nr:hypothetical protein [Synergistaceae bacterium]
MLENYTWYRVGFVTVLNGATKVTGIDTGWVKDGIKAGDIFILLGIMCEVDRVVTNTELELKDPYTGESITGTAYKIVRLARPVLSAEIALSLRELIDNWPQYESLVENYDLLSNSYIDLQDKYAQLLDSYQEVSTKYDVLATNCTELEGKYTKLKNKVSFLDYSGFYNDEDGDIAQGEPRQPDDDESGDDSGGTTPSGDDVAEDEDVYDAIDKILNP